MLVRRKEKAYRERARKSFIVYILSLRALGERKAKGRRGNKSVILFAIMRTTNVIRDDVIRNYPSSKVCGKIFAYIFPQTNFIRLQQIIAFILVVCIGGDLIISAEGRPENDTNPNEMRKKLSHGVLVCTRAVSARLPGLRRFFHIDRIVRLRSD